MYTVQDIKTKYPNLVEYYDSTRKASYAYDAEAQVRGTRLGDELLYVISKTDSDRLPTFGFCPSYVTHPVYELRAGLHLL